MTNTINVIHKLWQHHVPPKIIAEVLGINYASVTLYCRGFRATSHQLLPESLTAFILDPYAFTNNLASNDQIINEHLASGE